MKFSKLSRLLLFSIVLNFLAMTGFSYVESPVFVWSTFVSTSPILGSSRYPLEINVSNIKGYTFQIADSKLFVQTEAEKIPIVSVRTSSSSYRAVSNYSESTGICIISIIKDYDLGIFNLKIPITIGVKSLAICIDNQKPVISGVFDVPGNKKGVVLPHCWPLLTAVDSTSGLDHRGLQYALSNEGPWYSVDSSEMDLTDSGIYNVYFKAEDNSGNVSETIATVAVPDRSKSEYFILESTHELPQKSDDEFITSVETMVEHSGLWNTENQSKLREITLSAVELIIEAGHANGIYEKYHDDRDIKSMTIYADTITIRSYFKLPQVDLKIYARVLRIEGDGCFDVTPNTQSFIDSSVKLSEDGADGPNGASIELNIGKLEHEGQNIKCFIANGGTGQDGGPGIDGENGKNARGGKIYNSSSNYGPPTGMDLPFPDDGQVDEGVIWGEYYIEENTSGPIFFIAPEPPGFPDDDPYPYPLHTPAPPIKRLVQYGDKTTQTDGTNAVASGSSGKGGNGGTVSSNLNIKQYISVSGGKSGQVYLDTDDTPNVFEGGKPGNPIKSFYQYGINLSDIGKVEAYTAHPGADATVPARSASGLMGKISFQPNRELAWINPYSMMEMIKFINRLYFYDFYSEAYLLAQSCVEEIQEIENSPLWKDMVSQWKDDFASEFNGDLIGELVRILDSIGNSLDYFGNPVSWTPRLSMELSESLFENEINHAFKMLYLNQWVTSNYENVEKRIEGYKEQRALLIKEIDQFRKAYKEAIETIPSLESSIGELTYKEEVLQGKVDDIVEDLIKQAEQNLISQDVLGNLLNAAKVLGGLIKAIPMIDPVGDIIGSGLEIIGSYDVNQGIDVATLSSAASVFGNMGEKVQETEAAMNAFGTKFDELIINLDGDSQIDIDALASLSSSLASEFSSLFSFFNNVLNDSYKISVEESKFKEELERLCNEHPVFWPLKKEIEALGIEKKAFEEQLNSFKSLFNENPGKIQENLKGIVNFSKAIEDNMSDLNYSTVAFIEKRNKQALDRLQKYHYYFARAYEYRTLKPFEGELNMQAIVDEVKALVVRSTNAQLTLADYEILKQIYIDEIRSCYFNIVNEDNLKISFKGNAQLTFSNEMIDRLNKGERIIINPYEYGMFFQNEENLRITDVEIDSSNFEYSVSGDYGDFCRMNLAIRHSGKSIIREKGKPYIFRHNSKTGNSFFDLDNRINIGAGGIITPTRLSLADTSMLTKITGVQQNDLLLFSRLGVDSDFYITLSVKKENNDAEVRIDQLSLIFYYDYCKTEDNQIMDVLISNPKLDFEPLYEMKFDNNSDTDLYGRGSGYGCINRTFIINPSSSFTVTAPETFGIYKFKEWQVFKDRGEASIDTLTSPTIKIFLDGNYTLKPVYFKITDQDNINILNLMNSDSTLPSFSLMPGNEPNNSNLSWFEEFGIVRK